MSQIMKAFTGVFMVLFMMVTATGLLGGFFQVIHVQNLHAAMIDEMENSNYAKAVLEECYSVTEKSGYDLELTLYQENASTIICTEAGQLPVETSGVEMARIILKYPFQITFFDINLEQQLVGYAR